MNNIACPYEDNARWNPPEQSLQVAAYIKNSGETAGIETLGEPTEYIEAEYAVNLGDMR